MEYIVVQSKDFEGNTITKGKGFTVIPTGKITADVSITYLKLQNARDPAEKDRLIQLNKGYKAIYLVMKGKFHFTFWRPKKEKVTLKEKDYIFIAPGTQYEIKGTGEIALILFPAYSKKTFSHPSF